MVTWSDIEAQLLELKAQLSALKAECGVDAIEAFAALAEPVMDQAERAGYDIWHSASVFVTDMLIDADLVDEAERQH